MGFEPETSWLRDANPFHLHQHPLIRGMFCNVSNFMFFKLLKRRSPSQMSGLKFFHKRGTRHKVDQVFLPSKTRFIPGPLVLFLSPTSGFTKSDEQAGINIAYKAERLRSAPRIHIHLVYWHMNQGPNTASPIYDTIIKYNNQGFRTYNLQKGS